MSCCLVSIVPLEVNILLAKEVADDWLSTEISNSLNSLSPLLNLFVSEEGIKKEPSTAPFASVTIFVLPFGCAFKSWYWLPT